MPLSDQCLVSGEEEGIMSETVLQALKVMAIGLPVMFGVIILFMVVAKVLVALFPVREEEQN